jgi:SulP family sulfate permease
LRLGTYIKFIPYPVTVGFTAGIAVIIAASQIRDLLGLTLSHEPGALVAKLEALWGAAATLNPDALAVAAAAIAVMIALKRWRPHWPNILIAVALAGLASYALSLPIETIGTRFGGIPSALPAPHLPPLSWEKLQAVLPDAVSFALLGAIESLLSAVVADGMTGRRHRSNCELVAQGFANIASGLFGGIVATGTIARTATNVRAGARGPISGMLHSLFLLIFMMVAAPLASYIPLSALAAVLTVVAWNMAEKHAFATLVRSSWGDAAVLLATFLLTIFRDLTEGIVVGSVIGAFIFINRMAHITRVEFQGPLAVDDLPDLAGLRKPYDADLASDPDVVVYRISGAFFFGAASTVGAVLERIADRHKALVLDFSSVPFLDSSGANVIAGVTRKASRHGVKVYVTGASYDVRKELAVHGVASPAVTILSRVEDAVGAVHRLA